MAFTGIGRQLECEVEPNRTINIIQGRIDFYQRELETYIRYNVRDRIKQTEDILIELKFILNKVKG